jgi:nucleoredoxin
MMMRTKIILLSIVALAMTQLACNAVSFQKFSENLVTCENGVLKSYDQTKISKMDYVAVYFSAHWCPPCRAFTPKLVAFYNQTKPKHPNFEIIFVSNDRSEQDMIQYMQETGMKWTAVPFKAIPFTSLKEYAQRGIPNLVFLDKTGKVISSCYVEGKFQGPAAVLDEMSKTLK